MEYVQPNSQLGQMLEWCEQQSATDLHAQTGRPYCIRVHGELSRVPPKVFPPPTHEQLVQLLADNFSPDALKRIQDSCEVDLSFHCAGQRYRANFSKQKGLQ